MRVGNITLILLIMIFWLVGVGFISVGLNSTDNCYRALTGLGFIGVAVMLHLLWYVVKTERKLSALSKSVTMHIEGQKPKSGLTQKDREASQKALVELYMTKRTL